ADRAPVEGEAHVGTPVVERVDLPLLHQHEDRPALGGHDPAPLPREVAEAAHPHRRAPSGLDRRHPRSSSPAPSLPMVRPVAPSERPSRGSGAGCGGPPRDARLSAMPRAPRVLVVGLDSMDPDLILRWSGDGTLPTLGALRSRAAWGPVINAPRWYNGAM